jgi:predicted enzyme related to lactoylglutathione lyase
MKHFDEDRARQAGQGEKSRIGRRWFIASFASLPVFAATAPLTQTAYSAEATPSADQVGSIWWNELNAHDTEKARAFYAKVAGWTPKTMSLDDPSRPAKPGEPEYTVFSAKGQETAGATKLEDAEGEEREARWVPYIQVANVDAAVRSAEEMGGKIVESPYDVPKIGRLAVVEDPEGAVFGLVTPRR